MQQRHPQGGHRDPSDPALYARVGYYGLAFPPDRQVCEADGVVPAFALLSVVDLVENLGGAPPVACERVRNDRYVPRHTIVYVSVQKLGQLVGEVLGDIRRHAGGREQP